MGTLDRYKKKGGFIQILSLIESSEPAKAEKFLSIIAEESQVWADAIKEKALTLDKIKTFSESVLYESLETLPATVLANAMVKSPDLKDAILPCLSPITRKKIELAMKENPDPRPGDILTCQLRLISACRTAIIEGRVKQTSIPKELQIPENIEMELAHATWAKALSDPNLEIAAQSNPVQTNTNSASETSAELVELKRRLQKLLEENQHLKSQVIELQNKINQIKKVVL